MNKPLKVGVTGGIGAGKSVVCKIFAALGAPVYDADKRAKWLQVHQPELKERIKYTFGEEAYTQSGELNRSFLAQTVFSDSEKLKQINALVHPAVARDFADWMEKHKEAAYIIKEAALMIESGTYQSLDFLINVSAPGELRIKRVLLRDTHRNKEQVESIIAGQTSDAERKRLADFTIQNDDSQLLTPMVLELHEKWSLK